MVPPKIYPKIYPDSILFSLFAIILNLIQKRLTGPHVKGQPTSDGLVVETKVIGLYITYYYSDTNFLSPVCKVSGKAWTMSENFKTKSEVNNYISYSYDSQSTPNTKLIR